MQNFQVNLPSKEELDRLTEEDLNIAIWTAICFQKEDTGSWKDKVPVKERGIIPDFSPGGVRR